MNTYLAVALFVVAVVATIAIMAMIDKKNNKLGKNHH